MAHIPRTKEQIVKELYDRRSEFDSEMDYFNEYHRLIHNSLQIRAVDIKDKIREIESKIDEVFKDPAERFKNLVEYHKRIGDLNLELSRIYVEIDSK